MAFLYTLHKIHICIDTPLQIIELMNILLGSCFAAELTISTTTNVRSQLLGYLADKERLFMFQVPK